MTTRTLTIRNCSEDFLQQLRELRIDERRQLSAILEDCLQAYLDVHYEIEDAQEHDPVGVSVGVLGSSGRSIQPVQCSD